MTTKYADMTHFSRAHCGRMTFAFFKYAVIKCRFCGPVARQPVLPR